MTLEQYATTMKALNSILRDKNELKYYRIDDKGCLTECTEDENITYIYNSNISRKDRIGNITITTGFNGLQIGKDMIIYLTIITDKVDIFETLPAEDLQSANDNHEKMLMKYKE